MEVFMRRIVSLIAALSIFVGLFPAVSAGENDLGYTVVYDFINNYSEEIELGSEIAFYAKGGAVNVIDSYEKSNGFWKFDSQEGSFWINWHKSFGLYSYAKKNSSWYAIRIKVPADGEYSVSLDAGNYNTFESAGEIYLMDGGVSDIASSLTDENLLGTVDFTKETSKTFSRKKTLAKGEHILVFRSPSAGDTDLSMSIQKVTLTSGDGSRSAVMSAELLLNRERLNEGESALASLRGVLSNCTRTDDFNEAQVLYSSTDETVASVNPTSGEVTANKPGSADIKAEIQYDDGTVLYAKRRITVCEAGLSGAKVVYDFLNNYADGVVNMGSASEQTFINPSKGINAADTYEKTNGFWKAFGTDSDKVSITYRNASGSAGLRVYAYGAYTWAALKINVPVAGKYGITLECDEYSSFEKNGEMYLIDADTSLSEIEENLTPENKIMNVDYTKKKSVSSANIRFKEGENLIILNAPNGLNMRFSKITLDGGGEYVPMSARLEISGSGSRKQASAKLVMSDGSVRDAENAEYRSSDTSVAKIALSTGKITGVSGGNVTITADIEYNGKTYTASKDTDISAPTPIAPAGIDEEYSFINISSEWVPTQWSGSDPIRHEDIRGITYDYTAPNGNGNWEYYGTSPDWKPANRSVFSYSASANWARLQLAVPKGKWVGFKIKIPKAGKYLAGVTYAAYYESAGISDVYLVPLKSSEAEVEGELSADNLLGTVNYLDSTVSDFTVKSKNLSEIEFTEEDLADGNEYILVFKQVGNGAGESLRPRSFTLEGVNSISVLECTAEKSSLEVGETAQTDLEAVRLDGSTMSADEYEVKYISSDDAVAWADDGVIHAVSEGKATILISASDGLKTRTVSLDITVSDNSGIKSVEVNVPESIYVRGKGKIKVTAVMNSGKKIAVPNENIKITLTCSPRGCAAVADGIITGYAEGKAQISVKGTFKGNAIDEFAEISVLPNSSKSEPTYYTYADRENARKNIKKYSWASSKAKNKQNLADTNYMGTDRIDILVSQIAYEGIPRGRQIGKPGDPEYSLCRYCGENIVGKYGVNGVEGWNYNPFRNPWKLQCPDCKRLFPSNDFAGLYELTCAANNGVYNVELAHRLNEESIANGGKDYLHNDLYPEMGEGWGVDDGNGFRPKNPDGTPKTYANGVEEVHNYVAYYNYVIWNRVRGAIDTIMNSYIYTGDIQYGRAGAILLDRIADVYPTLDISIYNNEFLNTSGGAGTGNIQGCINDCEFAQLFAQAADAFYPALEDEYVINYLHHKALKEGLSNDKSSALKIWDNWESRILEEIFEGSKNGKIYGNYGMQQGALGIAAVALAKEPESGEMIDWLFKTGGRSSDYKSVSGGNVESTLIDVVDRDGMGDEASPRYNSIWIDNLATMVDALSKYRSTKNYNLFENPKYIKMYTVYPSLVLAGTHTAQIGDTGNVADLTITGGIARNLTAFEELSKIRLKTTDEGEKAEIARQMKILADFVYMQNGYTTEGLEEQMSVFSSDPESIKAEIKEYAEDSEAKSELLAGFGFAVLRDGGKYKSASASTSKNNRRDYWITFGRVGASVSHAHRDSLSIGIEAFGLNVSPDLGYPEATGTDPGRLQWSSSTLSHNTVMVDEKEQVGIAAMHGTPKHFDNSDTVKLMDIETPSDIYDSTSIYRRTVVMVKVGDDDSYGVDFFRVKGGNSHLFSFHAQSEKANAAEGLNLVPQTDSSGNYVGTYAGADTTFGKDPNSPAEWFYDTVYPRGYTWLKNVRRDNSPQDKFAVDFEITDYRNAVKDNKNIRLRMTMLNDFKMSSVALAGGYVPVKSTNRMMPETFEYVLAKREGKNLDSLFTTVYEPYKGERYIEDMESVSAVLTAGSAGADDAVKAVRVTRTDGRVDYIVYATNNKATYRIDGEFNFRGFIGVYSKNASGNVVYRYVNDGDIIGEDTEKTGSYTGTVFGFERELKFSNYIDIDSNNADASDLAGRCVYISNDGKQNAVYPINSAKKLENGKIRLDIGTVSLIRGYRDSNDFDSGYTYNIREGQKVVIPTSYSEENLPIFDRINMITVAADSRITVKINARSPIDGMSVVCSAKTMPTGAVYDAQTGVITWKPNASQVGDNHFVVTARDEMGRESTIHFTVKVYGATTPSGGGGGGGGDTPKPNPDPKPEPKPEPTPTPDPDPTPSDDGFIDIGDYGWAKDSINSLAKDGIIKGTSKNTFSPSANITRADFAILLVRAFKLEGEGKDNFADVSGADYFAKELAIAKENGIVGGIGDNKYAPRNTITREDMMVIVYRALRKLGYELKDGDVTVPDFDSVSDYAKEAVKALMANSLVNGKNGYIDPKANTTRAEVAVLLKRILDFSKEKK